MITHLLYLHGFRSSPQSSKAQVMQQWVTANRPDLVWSCPQLPPSPAQALSLLGQITASWPDEGGAVVGSSLGGFYATVMAEARGWRAVVLNPAVDPARDLQRHVGELFSWHDPELRFSFTAEHVEELRRMTPAGLMHPERYAALIAKGDELLDWREMLARYQGAHIRLLEGGDHALSDFADAHLGFVLHALEIQPYP